MSILETIILGIVEGLTEFLPISSTAHIDIVRSLFSLPPTDFIKSFEIIIQLGAILAVVVLYARKVFSSFNYIRNLIIAFIPTGIIGFILYKLIKSFLLGNILIIALALLLGGIIILIFENKMKKNKIDENLSSCDIKDMSIKQLIILGLAQALAVIPGVSRSGAVIIAGRSMKINRALITEFSFLLAVPTMLLAVIYDIYKSGFSFTSSEWGTIMLGFLVSFIVALIVIKWFLSYIRKHDFKIFGWYRIILGFLLILALYFNIL
jgi:undecaprenyl-diphosphatase